MPTGLADLTLEEFRGAAASLEATPAGVSVAAASAGFALGLLAKALAVSGRRREPVADGERLQPLIEGARAASSRMLQLATDDAAAFQAYLAAARSARTTEAEARQRQERLDASIRRAIDLPLAAAEEAAAGLRMCTEAANLTQAALIADVGAAAALLASALRAFLLCAHSNVRQWAPAAVSYRQRLAQDAATHEQALRAAESLLERIAAALRAAPQAHERP